jgi:hypothetical protein
MYFIGFAAGCIMFNFFLAAVYIQDIEIKKSTQINTSVIKAHEKFFYFSIPEIKVNINMNTLISAGKY